MQSVCVVALYTICMLTLLSYWAGSIALYGCCWSHNSAVVSTRSGVTRHQLSSVVFLETIVTVNQGFMLPTATQNRSAERLLDGINKEQDVTKLQNHRFFFCFFVFCFLFHGRKFYGWNWSCFLSIVNVVYLYGRVTGHVTLTVWQSNRACYLNCMAE